MIAATHGTGNRNRYTDLNVPAVGNVQLEVTQPLEDITKLSLFLTTRSLGSPNDTGEKFECAQNLVAFTNGAAGELPYAPRIERCSAMLSAKWAIELDTEAEVPVELGARRIECFLKLARTPDDVLKFEETYSFASRNIVSLLGGIYRLGAGFPVDWLHIGEVGGKQGVKDPGDLFRGHLVQCSQNHFLKTTCDGIVTSGFARDNPSNKMNFPMLLAGHKK